MVGTAAGAALRGIGTTAALVGQRARAPASRSRLAQALLPVLMRTRYPSQSGALTGTFSMAFTLGATLAAGRRRAARERARRVGSVAGLLGAPRRDRRRWCGRSMPGRTVIERAPRAALWRRPLAWAVALFFGIQSMAFYATLSWLPSILEDAGRSPETAGALLAFFSLVQLPTALLRADRSPRGSGTRSWLLDAITCWSRGGARRAAGGAGRGAAVDRDDRDRPGRRRSGSA